MFGVGVHNDVDGVRFTKCWSYNRLGLLDNYFQNWFWQCHLRFLLPLMCKYFGMVNFICIVILLWIQVKICWNMYDFFTLPIYVLHLFLSFWSILLEIPIGNYQRIKLSLYFESKFEILKFIQITSLVVSFKKSIIDFKLPYKRQKNLFEGFFSC